MRRECVRSIRPVVHQWCSCSKSSPRSGEGQKRGRMTELCRAGFVRFVTLRTGWLRSPFMRLVLPPRSAWRVQSRCHRQSPTKPAKQSWLRAGQGSIGRTQWASNGHACPNWGAAWRIQELRGRSRPPRYRHLPRWGRPIRQENKREWETYRTCPQNQQLNNHVNEGATILFGR